MGVAAETAPQLRKPDSPESSWYVVTELALTAGDRPVFPHPAVRAPGICISDGAAALPMVPLLHREGSGIRGTLLRRSHTE
jgi:hypothetical protein